jgi:hypothetical protein
MDKWTSVSLNRCLVSLLLCVVLSLTIGACSTGKSEGDQVVKTEVSEETVTPASFEDEEDTAASDDTARLLCPETDHEIHVDYIHLLIMRPPDSEVKIVAPASAEFYVTFRGDGTIDSDDFENMIPLGISGHFEDCTIEGDMKLSAEFLGFCIDGVVNLLIHENLHEITTTTTCPDGDPQTVSLEGLFSAPEDEIEFELRGTDYTYTIELDNPMQSLFYSWTFDFGTGLVPLVP